MLPLSAREPFRTDRSGRGGPTGVVPRFVSTMTEESHGRHRWYRAVERTRGRGTDAGSNSASRSGWPGDHRGPGRNAGSRLAQLPKSGQDHSAGASDRQRRRKRLAPGASRGGGRTPELDPRPSGSSAALLWSDNRRSSVLCVGGQGAARTHAGHPRVSTRFAGRRHRCEQALRASQRDATPQVARRDRQGTPAASGKRNPVSDLRFVCGLLAVRRFGFQFDRRPRASVRR